MLASPLCSLPQIVFGQIGGQVPSKLIWSRRLSTVSPPYAFAVAGQDLGGVLDSADRIEEGLERSLNLLGLIGQGHHAPRDLFDLRHEAHKVSHNPGCRARGCNRIARRITLVL